MYIKSDGTQGNCAKIDPETGDYMLDEYGNSVGDDSTNQMVYLAIFTLKDTSSVLGFGLDIDVSNAVMSGNVEARAKLAVAKALKHLTDKRLISLVSVTATRETPTGVRIVIQWINNSTGELNETAL